MLLSSEVLLDVIGKVSDIIKDLIGDPYPHAVTFFLLSRISRISSLKDPAFRMTLER